MFAALTDKFHSIFSKLGKQKSLTEGNVTEAVNEVRLALLEADVQYAVVNTFIKRVKEKALGEKIVQTVSASQQFVKIVHDELIALMGEQESELKLVKKPAVILLCGLQGSGKTTHAVKLACFLKKSGKFSRPCVVACDLQRPAAKEQLRILARDGGVDSCVLDSTDEPLQVAQHALSSAAKMGWDLLIFDTAGRLHVDEELMQQLQ